jgi:hypothetical protein
VLANSLTRALERVERRIRPSPEYAWYESVAWAQDRAEAEKRLAAKYDDRSRLIYAGYPRWRYRQDTRTMDKEIAALEEACREVEARRPVIVREPVFKLLANASGAEFPPPPERDRELEFCISRNVDAFLTGAVSEYYGRLYVTLRIYARYSRSWIFEESTIFSPEDINPMMEELASRLTETIQGSPPAALRVTADPAGAMLILQGRYAGRAPSPADPEIAEAAESPEAVESPAPEAPSRTAAFEADILTTAPGRAELTVQAEFHAPRTVELDLEAGTLTEISLSLTPLGRSFVTVRNAEDSAAAAVYRGALYLGQAPVTTELPAGSPGYFRMEGPDGAFATTVLPANTGAGSYGLSLRLRSPLPEGRVERSRRQFYGAWGRFWIAMPLSVLVNGLAMSVITAYNANPDGTEELRVQANTWYWAAMASDALAILFAGEAILRAGYYASVSSRGEPALERKF